MDLNVVTLFRGEGLTDYESSCPLCFTRQLDSVLIPKLNLVGHFGVFGTLALIVVRADDRHAFFPLFIRNVEQSYIASLRHELLNYAHVFVQLFKIHARARIDGELNHQEAVVNKVISEPGGGFPLLVGHYRQIKHGHEPAHAKRTVIHAAMLVALGNSGTQNGSADIASYARASELAEASMASINLRV